MKFKFTALTDNYELWQHTFIADNVSDAHKMFIRLFDDLKLGNLHIYTEGYINEI